MTSKQLYLAIVVVVFAYILIRLLHAWNLLRQTNRNIQERKALREQVAHQETIDQMKNVRTQSTEEARQ